MIVRRRTWLYRLHGQHIIHSISFKAPMTAAQAKAWLRQSVGLPEEMWGRSIDDVHYILK